MNITRSTGYTDNCLSQTRVLITRYRTGDEGINRVTWIDSEGRAMVTRWELSPGPMGPVYVMTHKWPGRPAGREPGQGNLVTYHNTYHNQRA